MDEEWEAKMTTGDAPKDYPDIDCPECSANHELPTLFLSADDAMEFIKEYI